MLEPVRQYAAERLERAGETVGCGTSTRDYVCDLGAAGRTGCGVRQQAEWVRRLDCEHGNLRVALATLRERGDLGRMARLGADIWLFWGLRGTRSRASAGWTGGGDPRVGDAGGRGPGRRTAGPGRAALCRRRLAGTRAAAAAAVDAARGGPVDVTVLAEALLLQGGGGGLRRGPGGGRRAAGRGRRPGRGAG